MVEVYSALLSFNFAVAIATTPRALYVTQTTGLSRLYRRGGEPLFCKTMMYIAHENQVL